MSTFVCQVIEDLLKFSTAEILNTSEADVDYVRKRAAAETGQQNV